jgi:hypothetical protein
MIAPTRIFRTARIIQFGIPMLATAAPRSDDRLYRLFGIAWIAKCGAFPLALMATQAADGLDGKGMRECQI